MDGTYHSVEAYHRDYRPVDGLMMPFLLETKVPRVAQTEKIQIDGDAINLRVEDFRLPSYHETWAAKLSCGGAFLSLALVSTAFLSGAAVVAQVASPASPARQTRHGYRRPTIDNVVEGLAKNLDLNEAQQSAVTKILEERQQETLRIRLDPSIPPEARIDRFRALQETTVERIRAVLNEEQRKKYDPLAPQRIQPAPQQRSVEDWLKATTPH